MKLHITRKGALYAADCSKCGMSLYAHEWASHDPNGDRDAMQAGTYCCEDCGGRADPETFWNCGKQYAARYSADGYLDCTDWTYGRNRRELARDVRAMYGVTP